MEQLDHSLWIHNDTMTVLGTPLRLRSTIIKLGDGALWVHSPTALTADLNSKVDALGPVRYIVGPNNFHNRWINEWHDHYPDAELYVSRGIPKKIKLTQYKILNAYHPGVWENDLNHAFLAGVRLFNESVFLHKPSKSLIVTDLIQNYSNERPTGMAGLVTRCIFQPLGYKGLCIAPLLKLGIFLKDKSAFAASLKRIQKWDFERIIVTHGDVIELNAKAEFSQLCNQFLIEAR